MPNKRLYRSRDQRVAGGVAGGIANYFEIDPVFVRIAFILLTLFNGIGLLVYLLLWLLVPNVDSVNVDARAQVRENVEDMRNAAEDVVNRVRNTFSA